MRSGISGRGGLVGLGGLGGLVGLGALDISSGKGLVGLGGLVGISEGLIDLGEPVEQTSRCGGGGVLGLSNVNVEMRNIRPRRSDAHAGQDYY